MTRTRSRRRQPGSVPRSVEPPAVRRVTARPWRWRAAVILIAGVLTYANGLANPFVFDDYPAIVDNPQVRDWTNLRQVVAAAQGSPVAGRPLVAFTFALNYAADGLNATGYRVVNLGIHLACALLLGGIVRRTLRLPAVGVPLAARADDVGFVAALVWTVHPLGSEVVDYVTQRTESLMALFYLLTLYATVRALTSTRASAWRGLAVLTCGLGMACKEPMATAPVMIVLFERVFAFDSIGQAFASRWRFYAALAATLLVLAVLYWSGPREFSGGYASTHVSTWTYLLNQTVILAHYLRLVVWPRGLVVAYGWTPTVTLGDVLPYALAMTCAAVAAVVALARWPKVGFLAVWFFITVAPTSSLVPIAAEVGAERRMYVPLMGLVVLGVVGVAAALDRLRRDPAGTGGHTFSRAWTVPVLTGALVVAQAATTFARNREYVSETVLARTMLERWPSGFAHHVVGVQLGQAGHYPEAVAQLRQAVDGFPPARYDLGVALFTLGRWDEAIAELEHFVADEPRLAQVATAHTLIGRALETEGRTKEAAPQFRLALSASPPDPTAEALLADALFQQQAYEEAIPHYRAYIALHPMDVGPLTKLGAALVATRRTEDALVVFRQAVAAAPRDTHVRENLAQVLIDSGDLASAIGDVTQVLVLAPADPVAHDLAGRLAAGQGRVDDARREFERALQLDPGFEPARAHLRGLPVK
jgi:Flp pilus assembly protein TadD